MKSEAFNIDNMIGMKEFPDNYFDLAVPDPEYGLGEDGRKTRGRSLRRDNSPITSIDHRNGAIIKVKPKDYKINSWDEKPPNQTYFTEVIRVSKTCIIWGSNNFYFKEKLSSSGRVIWDKVNGDNDFSDCEIAWTNCHNKTRFVVFKWAGFMQGVGFGRNSQHGDHAKKEFRIHPTQKPIALYEWIFKNYAEEGQKILDTHLGSGSSRIAAYNYKMDFTGYEIDKDYFEASEKRFQNHVAQLKMFA